MNRLKRNRVHKKWCNQRKIFYLIAEGVTKCGVKKYLALAVGENTKEDRKLLEKYDFYNDRYPSTQ